MRGDAYSDHAPERLDDEACVPEGARVTALGLSREFDVRHAGARDVGQFALDLRVALIRELRERNVSLVSHQEPWLNGSDATTELLAAVAAWVATQESVRRSERIRAGLARRRAQGKPMGGAASNRGKDKHPRRTEGYKQAWARRKAAQ